MFNREMNYLGRRKSILYVIYQLYISLLLGIVLMLDYERLQVLALISGQNKTIL